MNTILVVDDSDAVRELAVIFLEISGYRTIEADGVIKASNLIRSMGEEIDLVITDYHMPDGVGTQLCNHGLPTILMSAGVDPDLVDNLIGSGQLIGFLPKPFQKAELLAVVRDYLNNRDEPNMRNNPYYYY